MNIQLYGENIPGDLTCSLVTLVTKKAVHTQGCEELREDVFSLKKR